MDLSDIVRIVFYGLISIMIEVSMIFFSLPTEVSVRPIRSHSITALTLPFPIPSPPETVIFFSVGVRMKMQQARSMLRVIHIPLPMRSLFMPCGKRMITNFPFPI